jgi:DNA-binding CsgD family transcriptional regulator
MKDFSLSSSLEIQQRIVSLPFQVLGEFWFNNNLLWIIPLNPPHTQKSQNCDFNLYQEDIFYTISGEIKIEQEKYLVVKPNDKLIEQVLNPQKLLSERELQIAELVAYGQSNKQIANELKISEWTVSTHLRRAFIKLNVDSRAEMVYRCASLIYYRMQRIFSPS